MLRHPHDLWEIFADDEIPGDDDPSIELSRGRRVADMADMHLSGKNGDISVPWHMQEQFIDAVLKTHERCKVVMQERADAAAAERRRTVADMLRFRGEVPTPKLVETEIAEQDAFSRELQGAE